MRTNLDNVAVETLVPELINETEDINRLNVMKQNQRDAFLKAIATRPKLLEKVKGLSANQLLTVAIKKDYRNFTYLKREQYTEELAQIFLSKRLNEYVNEDKSSHLTFEKSMDNKLVFIYSYVSQEGDELYYLDKELQVPASIRSSLKMSFKLTDALALIDKMDTHITQLGQSKICSTLTDIISSNYRAILNEYIVKNDIGYYTLCSSLTEVEEYLKEKMNKAFESYGIVLNEMIIKKLAIPKDIQFKLEDQAFQIRKKRAEIDADTEFSKKSLEAYAEKLEIQEKYPNATHSLTEYEKDLALKRYLIKMGQTKEEEIDHSIKIKQKIATQDDAISQREDIIPEVPQKKNVFKITYIVMLLVSLIVSFSCFAAGTGTGLILLAVTVLIFGLIAAFKHDKFKQQKVEVKQDTLEGGE